ncbi:TIGR04222 domain-containing membrane protein [Kitasatospora sp. NPDC004531]
MCAAAGLLVAGLLRWLPGRGRTDGLAAVEVAAVRGGARAALATAVVELHGAGTIDTGPHGRLRRAANVGPGRDATSLHRAVWTALSRAVSLADVAVAPTVRRARAELRADLTARGLRCGPARLAAARLLALASGGTAVAVAALPVGLPLAVLALVVVLAPARTAAGHRLLRELRRQHPLPDAAPPLPGDVGLLTALHGPRALRLLVPRFAARARLLGGRAARDTVARHDGAAYGYSAGDDYSPSHGGSDS